jgi:hypothetical protein
VCSPNTGAPRRICGGVFDKRSGELSARTGPRTECSTVVVMPRSFRCGSAIIWSYVFTGPAGTPAVSIAVTQWSVVSVTSTDWMSRSSSSPWASRSWAVAYSGRDVQSGRPSTLVHSACHMRWVLPPTVTYPSLVR